MKVIIVVDANPIIAALLKTFNINLAVYQESSCLPRINQIR